MIAPFTLTPELQEEILMLARQADIRSISCPFDDFDLWEGLLREQVQRARATGLEPQEALCLMGPDSGIPGVTSPRYIDDDDIPDNNPPEPDPRTGKLAPHLWGGKVHIPYEGACGGDLFILPKWHNLFPERLFYPESKLSSLLGGRRCNYLLTNRNIGEIHCAVRTQHAGWFLYKNRVPYEDCNPFHEHPSSKPSPTQGN